METFSSLEKKLERLSEELAELKNIKELAKKDYKNAEQIFYKAKDKYNEKEIEVDSLKAGLKCLYEKKLNILSETN